MTAYLLSSSQIVRVGIKGLDVNFHAGCSHEMQYVRPCDLAPEGEGGFVVSLPDVPEALTGGDERAEALAMAEDGLAASLSMYVKERDDIPVPSAAVAGQASVAIPAVVATNPEL